MGIKRILEDLTTLEKDDLGQARYYSIKNLEKDSPIYRCIKDLKKYKHKYIDLDSDKYKNRITIINSDNSYNYDNAGFIYQYTFFIFKSNPYINICFHRYGDVRCNYTETVTLKMTEDELTDHISDYSYELETKNYITYQNLLTGAITVYEKDKECDIIGEYIEEVYYENDLLTDEVRLVIDAFGIDLSGYKSKYYYKYNPNYVTIIYINDKPTLIYDNDVITYDYNDYIYKFMDAGILFDNLRNVYDYNDYIAIVYDSDVTYYIHKDIVESNDTLNINDFKCEYFWLIDDVELRNYITHKETNQDRLDIV